MYKNSNLRRMHLNHRATCPCLQYYRISLLAKGQVLFDAATRVDNGLMPGHLMTMCATLWSAVPAMLCVACHAQHELEESKGIAHFHKFRVASVTQLIINRSETVKAKLSIIISQKWRQQPGQGLHRIHGVREGVST